MEVWGGEEANKSKPQRRQYWDEFDLQEFDECRGAGHIEYAALYKVLKTKRLLKKVLDGEISNP